MNKTCNKCGASVPADQKFCTSCGGNEFTEAAAVHPTVAPVQPAVAPVAPVAGAQPPKKGMPTWLKVILIILLVLGLMGACTVGCVVMTGKAIVDGANEALEDLESDLGDYDYDYDYDYDTDEEEDTSTDTGVYGFDDTFTFDDLEITFGSDYTFTTISNQYSDYYGKDIVRVPVTVTNKSTETHGLNMFHYNIYGTSGSKTNNVSTWFSDDSLDYAGDLRSGASYTKYIYFVYDADGTYVFEFDNYSEEVEVELEITKQ
jgi:hypothetical protein